MRFALPFCFFFFCQLNAAEKLVWMRRRMNKKATLLDVMKEHSVCEFSYPEAQVEFAMDVKIPKENADDSVPSWSFQRDLYAIQVCATVDGVVRRCPRSAFRGNSGYQNPSVLFGLHLLSAKRKSGSPIVMDDAAVTSSSGAPRNILDGNSWSGQSGYIFKQKTLGVASLRKSQVICHTFMPDEISVAVADVIDDLLDPSGARVKAEAFVTIQNVQIPNQLDMRMSVQARGTQVLRAVKGDKEVATDYTEISEKEKNLTIQFPYGAVTVVEGIVDAEKLRRKSAKSEDPFPKTFTWKDIFDAIPEGKRHTYFPATEEREEVAHFKWHVFTDDEVINSGKKYNQPPLVINLDKYIS